MDATKGYGGVDVSALANTPGGGESLSDTMMITLVGCVDSSAEYRATFGSVVTERNFNG